MPQFVRYIGIDYSGAETADSSCKGLRVYVAESTGTSRGMVVTGTSKLPTLRRRGCDGLTGMDHLAGTRTCCALGCSHVRTIRQTGGQTTHRRVDADAQY
jgi:hypothetical protein